MQSSDLINKNFIKTLGNIATLRFSTADYNGRTHLKYSLDGSDYGILTENSDITLSSITKLSFKAYEGQLLLDFYTSDSTYFRLQVTASGLKFAYFDGAQWGTYWDK